jgi:hypothetical protein
MGPLKVKGVKDMGKKHANISNIYEVEPHVIEKGARFACATNFHQPSQREG